MIKNHAIIKRTLRWVSTLAILVASPLSYATTYTATGLTDGTTYSFAVSGSNVYGQGADSSSTTVTPIAVKKYITAKR